MTSIGYAPHSWPGLHSRNKNSPELSDLIFLIVLDAVCSTYRSSKRNSYCEGQVHEIRFCGEI